MKQTLIIGLTAVGLSAAMLALGLYAGNRIGPTFSGEPSAIAAPADGADRARIETIVREYLISNPEIMLEVQTALQEKQENQQRLAQSEAIAGQSNAIFKSSGDGIIGNPDGDFTIVEFFDYNCGFCKRALADMESLIAKDPELRFVMKEFPILGPDSQKAHVVSMAFKALHPDKYPDFHRRLLGNEGKADEESAMKIATDLGADEAALRTEMEKPEIQEFFSQTYELANALSITGTPSYVIGDEVVFGALGEAVLEEKLVNLRKCESTVC